MLDLLSPDHVHMLLCSLRASYHSALEFDCRPGLKFLVQKVSQLSNAANLYKQAGAAWSLIAMTLFELCQAKLESAKVDIEEIKKALEAQQKRKNTHQFSSLQEDEVTREDTGKSILEGNKFFVDLHNLFLEICELYVDIIVDKDGTHSKLDAMSKQQLYFLTIEPDDFYEMMKSPKSKEETSPPPATTSPPPRTPSANSGSNSRKSSVKGSKPTSPTTNKPKPFTFSDFTSQSVRPESPNVSEDSDVMTATTSKIIGGVMREDRLGSNTDTPTDAATATMAAGADEEDVFRMATQAEFDSMMSEYRFRKGKRTMPSSTTTPPTSAGATNPRKNPFLAKPKSSSNANTDPEIANQQKESLMADSEAQMTVWTELVLVFFHLSSTVSDENFRVFLPLLFPGVKSLTAYAKNEKLKQQIAEFFQRVASIYGFNPDV